MTNKKEKKQEKLIEPFLNDVSLPIKILVFGGIGICVLILLIVIIKKFSKKKKGNIIKVKYTNQPLQQITRKTMSVPQTYSTDRSNSINITNIPVNPLNPL